MADRVLFLTGGRLSAEASTDRIERSWGCERRADPAAWPLWFGRVFGPSCGARCRRWAGIGRRSSSACSASR